MKIEYVDHLGNDLTVVNAARVSFDKESEWEITETGEYYDEGNWKPTYDENLSAKDKKLIKYLANHNHWTPFSHPQITLRETVPIFVARQRFKHMVGFTYNEVSRRYVDDPPEFYFPSSWRGKPENAKQGSSETVVVQIGSEGISDLYEMLIQQAETLYNAMVKADVAPEQARMVLPQSMMTSYWVTGSLAAFARAYKQRIDSHSQVEIQMIAQEWDQIIRPLYSESWSALVD